MTRHDYFARPRQPATPAATGKPAATPSAPDAGGPDQPWRAMRRPTRRPGRLPGWARTLLVVVRLFTVVGTLLLLWVFHTMWCTFMC